MALPFFYIDSMVGEEVSLNEETSKHIIQVLRMKVGEQLQLTDGKGNLFTAEIIDDNRKRCTVKFLQTLNFKPSTLNVTVAISLLKNTTRFEWFLEKATEIGVRQIVPLICNRTEKNSFKYERFKSILVSAMLQSQQTWLPVLNEPVKFDNFIKTEFDQTQKFIAHCEDENNKMQLTNQPINQSTNQLILIGPEGDFTKGEIQQALEKGFAPVALGNTRLRTETAGIVAATLLCVK